MDALKYYWMSKIVLGVISGLCRTSTVIPVGFSYSKYLFKIDLKISK
jgi:hypothetical protein